MNFQFSRLVNTPSDCFAIFFNDPQFVFVETFCKNCQAGGEGGSSLQSDKEKMKKEEEGLGKVEIKLCERESE